MSLAETLQRIQAKVEFIAHLRSILKKYEDDWQEEAFFSVDGSETSDRAKGLSDLCEGYEVVLENEIRILNNLKATIRTVAIKAAMGKHSRFDGFFLYWCNVSTDWLKKEGKYFVDRMISTDVVYLKESIAAEKCPGMDW